MIDLINRINTTNTRILFTLVVVLFTALRYLVWGVPYRMAANSIPVVDGWGYWLLFCGGMAGLDVAQFWAKRSSEPALAAAKNSGPAVTVEAPSQVTVTAEPQPIGQPLGATRPAAAPVVPATAPTRAPIVKDD